MKSYRIGRKEEAQSEATGNAGADIVPVEYETQDALNVSGEPINDDGLDSNAVYGVQEQEDAAPIEIIADAEAIHRRTTDEEDEEYDEEEFEKPHRRFVSPTREQLLNWLPFLAILLLGAILRFWGLGDKPLHHDESLHAYFSLQLLHNMQDWSACFTQAITCYQYNPLLHGPFQFHAIAFVYQISQWLGAPDHGVNTTTVRIAAATLGTLIVGLPYFLRDYLGKVGALLACFLLAVSPSMVYFSRFAREDIYFAFFTFLFIVGTARYLRERKLRWLIMTAAGFAFAYATKESIFLEIAIFGSFLGALIAWELGLRWSVRSRIDAQSGIAKFLPRTGAPILLGLYFIILAPIAKVLFAWMKNLSVYITNPKNTAASDLYVQGLKDKTVALIPWLGILLGVYVLTILAREMMGKLPPLGKRNFIARRIDPSKQTLLDTIFTMPWTHWFFAILCAWTIFLVLFTVLFTNIRGGIGDGIWQGLYYWLQQQEVARGGQPWYYYLMLIPLYEQIGLVFGIVGIVRCLLRPTRFRLFLVYWFVGSVFIYSWAAEKMPWLMIHMTVPMMLLAAIGLEPAVLAAYNFIKQRVKQQSVASAPQKTDELVQEIGGQYRPVPASKPRRIGVLAGSGAIATVILALLLLAPTLHNMYEVSYVHAADGPHEMMVYVQTTTDVNIVMAKVDALDQKYDNGQRNMPIGLTNDATWPFAWYLRDYNNVCYNYPDGCSTTAKNIPVIIVGGDTLYSAEVQYTAKVANNATYAYHQYKMRTWWDEGYKPTPCVQTKTNLCTGQLTYGGVGLGLWLSYGDNPPPGAKFNLARAANNIWQWWWNRKAIGSTDGSYDMGLFIRSDLQSNLGVTP